MSKVYTFEELETLPRRQLQDLAKLYKIRANQKTSSLVEKLKEYYLNQEREKDKENENPNKSQNTKNVNQSIKKKKIEETEEEQVEEEPTRPPPEKKMRKNKEEESHQPLLTEISSQIGKGGKEEKQKKKIEILPLPPSPPQKEEEEDMVHLDHKENEKPKKSQKSHNTKNALPNGLFPDLSSLKPFPWVNSCVYHVRVLASLEKSLGVSSRALMLSNDLLVKCLLEVFLVGMKLSEKKTLTLSILEQGMKEIIPGDLFKHARSEVRKATFRYSSSANPERPISYRSGLMFNVDEVAQFLKTIGIVTDTECTVGVTALTEYLCAEVFDQAFLKIKEKKTILVTVKHIFEGIKADSELWTLFKRFLEEPSMDKPADQIRHIFGKLPKSEEISGASPKAIQLLTSKLKFELPESLVQFFLLSNGNPSLGVDSCTEITELFSKYELLEDVYQFIGWIPIHHVLDEVYNCLDVDTDRVIQINANTLKNIEKFPVLANSLCEYITNFVSSDHMKGIVQDHPTLQEVDPVVGKLVHLLLM